MHTQSKLRDLLNNEWLGLVLAASFVAVTMTHFATPKDQLAANIQKHVQADNLSAHAN